MRLKKTDGRKVMRGEAVEIGTVMLARFRELGLISRGCIAGSVRRGKQLVNDLDLVVIPSWSPTNEKPAGMKKAVWEPLRLKATWEKIKEELGEGAGGGPSKVWGLIGGVYVDVMFTTDESWGAAMMHCTGPMELNIAQRSHALRSGLTLNEYGVWRDGIRLAGAEEREVYAVLKLNFLEPEART